MKRNYLRLLITTALFFILLMCGTFFIHNKTDIINSVKARGELSYDNMTKTCKGVVDNVYAPCFLENLESFFSTVSLTGVSVGLNFGFEFMEEDKKNSSAYPEGINRDVEYSLYYLEMNNLAIEYANKQFLGINILYGFFLSGLYNYYSKAFEFSENMIKGLEGEDGILKIEDPVTKEKFETRFKTLKEEYLALRADKEAFLEKEKNRLESTK